MNRIHLLKKESYSRLQLNKKNKLFIIENVFSYSDTENKSLYITAKEKINEGDYGIGFAKGLFGHGRGFYLFKNDGSMRGKVNSICKGGEKVIFTIDLDLIKYGVQVIDEEFLLWYISKYNDSGVGIDYVESIGNKILIPDENDIYSLASIILKSHPDFISEGFSEYQNGRYNGIIEGIQYQLNKNKKNNE